MEKRIKEVLKKYCTLRAHDSVSSDTGYYDFLANSQRIRCRISNHFKDISKEDSYYPIQIIKGSGDTWVIKYKMFTMTESGDNFIKLLDSFLFAFPHFSSIIDNSIEQTKNISRLLYDCKTDYEKLRKEYKEYKEKFPGLHEVEEKLKRTEAELKKEKTYNEDLLHNINSLKSRISDYEKNNIGAIRLAQLRSLLGEVINTINIEINEIKKINKNE